MLVWLILTTLFIAGTSAIKVQGDCPVWPTSNRNLNLFSGKWYLLAAMTDGDELANLNCLEYEFKYNSSANIINYHSSAISTKNGERFEYNATGIPQANGTIILKSTDDQLSAPIYISETDYDKFAIVSSCVVNAMEPFEYHTETSYILTRERYSTFSKMPLSLYGTIKDALFNDLGYIFQFFTLFDSTNCPQVGAA